MIVYRVLVHDRAAAPGSPGSAEYLHHPQGQGRLDNPSHYELWYFAVVPEGAIGEIFGDISEWVDGMFEVPFMPGARRALGHFEIPDDLNILDLDDAKNLLDRGLRPTQVIARNRAATQAWALSIFRETGDDGSRKWDGVRWWSFQRPQWPVIGLWVAPGESVRHRVVGVDRLDLSSASVMDAAATLVRRIHRQQPDGHQ